MESSDSWCFWNQVHFKRRDQWVMKFLATNILSNVGITYEHKVSTFDSVIPERARNLVAEVRGPREVNLSWTLPHPIDVFPGNVTLEIKYRTRQVGGTVDLGPWHLIDMWEMKPVRFTREILSKEIGQLHPYVEYEFQVRLHTGSGSIRDNMWSQPAHVANITRSTRPTKAPKTSRGTFVVEETKYNRNINLLWQEVDRLYRNAPNFHYVIAVYNNNDDSLHSRTDNITKGYHILRNLSKEVPYRFEVMPVNQEGPPEDQSLKSSVLVREMSAILQTPRYFRVIAFQGQGQTTYSARWRIPDQSAEVESVTLYWCRQLEYENSCKTKLEWKKIDNPTSGAENLTNFDSSTRYLFGISLESRDSSSGIKWISCIANHGDRPPRIEDFSRTYITPTSVGLQWELNCKAQAADPRGFNISYCLVPSVNDTCSSADEKYVLINKESVMMYEVGNLRPFSHYNFNIATVTDVGLSHWSRTLTVTTEADKPSGPPQHLRAKEKGRRWVLLAWAAPLPEDRNGKIVSYEVGGMYVSSARVDAHTRETTHNFTNLDEYTEYTFEVKACSVGRRELLCSDVTGVAAIRTKIGWPGKVGDIEQMSNSEVGWDFDASDCNGPSCSFELRYEINGTTHSQEIPAGRVSVDISGLNISCSEEQHEVSVSMRAVGRDEENRRLDGPWSKKKLVCFPPGSSRGHDIPSFRPQLPQNTFDIRPPTSNQYPGFLLVPEFRREDMALPLVWLPVNLHQLAFVTEMYEQHYPGNGGTTQPLLRNEEALTEGLNREQEQMFSNEADREQQYNYESSVRDLQTIKYWHPIMWRRNAPMIPSFYYQGSVNPSTIRTRDGHQLPNSALRNHVGNNERQRQSPSHNSMIEHENTLPQERQNDHRGDHRVSSCPLIELMRAKGAEVSLNANSEKFELNIKGHSNIFKILQAASSIPLLPHDYSGNGEFISNRVGSSPPEVLNENMAIVSGGLEGSDAFDGEPLFEEMRKVSTPSSHSIMVTINQTLPGSVEDQSFPVGSADNNTETFVSESRELPLSSSIIAGSENLSNDSALVVDVIPSFTAEDDEDPAQIPSVSNDYTFQNINISMQSQPLNSSEGVEDLRLDDSVFVDAASTPTSSETPVYSDQQSVLHNETQPIDENLGAINNSTESTETHSTETFNYRSRRSIQSQIQIVEPVSSDVEPLSLERYQSDASIYIPVSSQEDLEQNTGKETQSFVETNHTLRLVQNHDADEEHIDYGLSHVSQDSHETSRKQVLGNSQLTASTVYHLGPVGSFNGNVESVVSQVIDEKSQGTEIAKVHDSSILSGKMVSESNSLSVETVRRDPSEEGILANILNHQRKPFHSAPCPFVDLVKSEDVTLHLHSYNSEEFELNVQGSGHLHDIIKKIFLGLQSEVISRHVPEESENHVGTNSARKIAESIEYL